MRTTSRATKVIDLDLMHPEMLPSSGVKWDFKHGSLVGSAAQADGGSLRWVGGFNPFATYDLVLQNAAGDGAIGMTFRHSTNGDSLNASLQFKAGKPEAITWNVLVAGKPVTEEKWPVPTGTSVNNLTLRAHSRQLKQEIAISLSVRRGLLSYFTCLGSGL